MKYLFIGDIHTHRYMFDDLDRLDKEYKFDKVIFLGDYVDDWSANGQDSIDTLNKLLQYKKRKNDKYILLLGNHELSYLGYPCAGHDYLHETAINSLLKSNLKHFNIISNIRCHNKNFICSHAGISTNYLDTIFPESENYLEDLYSLEKDLLNNLHKLTLCSYLRGGNHEYSSLLWCDKREHEHLNEWEYPEFPYQIIGHTPVRTCEAIDCRYEDGSSPFEYYFIDTHSTYRDGSPYGDKSYLIWNENKFEKIY